MFQLFDYLIADFAIGFFCSISYITECKQPITSFKSYTYLADDFSTLIKYWNNYTITYSVLTTNYAILSL